MKHYFDKKGHLTKTAFEALQQNELNTLQRLEIAEHLSFCDTCVAAYTAWLNTVPLVEPFPTSKETILKRIKERLRCALASRYATAAVAAGLTIVLWSGGVFTMHYNIVPPEGKLTEITQQFNNATVNFVEKITEGIGKASINFKEVFHHE